MKNTEKRIYLKWPLWPFVVPIYALGMVSIYLGATRPLFDLIVLGAALFVVLQLLEGRVRGRRGYV